MRLKIKLTIAFTVMIVVVTGAIAFLSIQRETTTFNKELKKQGLILTNTLADECKAAFITDKFVHIMDYIDTISRREYVVYVMVRDTNGTVKAHSEMDKIGGVITDSASRVAYEGTPYVGICRSAEGQDIYLLAVPVTVNGNVVGIAQVGYSLRSLETSTANAQKQIIVITIGGIIVGILFGIILSQQLVRPISRLKDAANAIGKNDFNTKIDIASKDEIGDLARSFNRMTENLHRSRNELVKARQYTDSIFKSMVDTLIVVDPEDGIRGLNQAALDLLGYTGEELIGQPLETIFAAEEVPLKKAKFAELIEQGKLETYETHYKTKNGGKIPVLFGASVMRDQDGNIMSLVCTATDITERKRLQSSLLKSERRLRSLSSRLLAAQEQERKRISRDLHDDLGQVLTAVLLDITQAKKLGTPVASGISSFLDRIQAGTQEALQRVRSLSATLRPGVLDHLGLKAAVVSFLEEIRERTGLTIVEEIHVDHNNISEPVTIAIYRILQEATTNIVKHAGATQVIVKLQSDQQIIALSIADNGQGFTPESLDMDQGLGILGMKERTEWLGGVFRIESAPVRGHGTRIYAEIPISAEKITI
jgi:PAS domain S-box-containing protein